VILFSLALPVNPLNLITRLAVGTAGMEQWLLLGGTMMVIVVLACLTQWYAQKIAKTHNIS